MSTIVLQAPEFLFQFLNKRDRCPREFLAGKILMAGRLTVSANIKNTILNPTQAIKQV